jgi:hypothetical protein
MANLMNNQEPLEEVRAVAVMTFITVRAAEKVIQHLCFNSRSHHIDSATKRLTGT